MKLTRRASFWIGFSLALGAILAVAVATAARSGGSSPSLAAPKFAARGTHQVAPSSRPLAETLAVFARARRPTDTLPVGAAAAFAALGDQEQAGAGVRPGTPDAARSRLLLSDVGSWHGAIYAAPTAGGNVCYLVTAGPEGCATGFTQAFPVGVMIFDPDALGDGASAAITGLVPNDVRSVTVIVNGVGHPARVANNAYFYQLPAGTAASPDALLIGYADGGALKMALPALAPAGTR